MIDLPFDFTRGLDVLVTILTISLALCFIRLFLGPTLPNRTMAFDSISIHAVAILALYAVRIGAPSILDVAIVVAILGFLGTTILARYWERSAPLYHAIIRDRTRLRREVERKVAPIETGETAIDERVSIDDGDVTKVDVDTVDVDTNQEQP